MNVNDFEKKQMVFVFTMDGEKIVFRNDNICVIDSEGVIKLQITCYRVLSLNIVGHVTITSAIIQKSNKFGFPIFLMTTSFRTYDCIGHRTEGNTVLRRTQYEQNGCEIAKQIVCNKIRNQIDTLNLQRTWDWKLRESIDYLESLYQEAHSFMGDYRGLMGIEGNASKCYFERNFDNCHWSGRKPRVKQDPINSTLDIGYTILFNFIDTITMLFGFDTYYGVYHREFYQRKSLICDLVEPFRPLIDWQVRKAINLGQIKEEHFNNVKGKYLLDIRFNKDYIRFLSEPLLIHKMSIFRYIRDYYRAVMREYGADQYPFFTIRE